MRLFSFSFCLYSPIHLHQFYQPRITKDIPYYFDYLIIPPFDIHVISFVYFIPFYFFGLQFFFFWLNTSIRSFCFENTSGSCLLDLRAAKAVDTSIRRRLPRTATNIQWKRRLAITPSVSMNLWLCVCVFFLLLLLFFFSYTHIWYAIYSMCH